MSLKKPSKEQPVNFEFTTASIEAAKLIVAKYPEGKQQSAVMALLYLAQKQNENWIPLAAMKYIGKFLDMPYIKVYEVATFYTMYNLAPVGKHLIQICTTTPCMIRGAYKLVEACKEKISEKENELSKNKSCSWMEVECLGACVNAPMMQINAEYYEDQDFDIRFRPGQAVLSVSGYGDARPINKGNINTANAENRRIDLRFIMMTPRSLDEADIIGNKIKQGVEGN